MSGVSNVRLALRVSGSGTMQAMTWTGWLHAGPSLSVPLAARVATPQMRQTRTGHHHPQCVLHVTNLPQACRRGRPVCVGDKVLHGRRALHKAHDMLDDVVGHAHVEHVHVCEPAAVTR